MTIFIFICFDPPENTSFCCRLELPKPLVLQGEGKPKSCRSLTLRYTNSALILPLNSTPISTRLLPEGPTGVRKLALLVSFHYGTLPPVTPPRTIWKIAGRIQNTATLLTQTHTGTFCTLLKFNCPRSAPCRLPPFLAVKVHGCRGRKPAAPNPAGVDRHRARSPGTPSRRGQSFETGVVQATPMKSFTVQPGRFSCVTSRAASWEPAPGVFHSPVTPVPHRSP